MIPAAELRRRAGEWHVSSMLVELDYVLGCFLSRWFAHPSAGKMLFKGGTCLRKCYFPDFRFSQDVDIAALGELDTAMVGEAVDDVAHEVENAVGVDMTARPARLEASGAAPNSLYVEARIYFRGPLQRTGWPQAIRVDISTGEPIAFAAVRRRLHHPYSDADDLGVRDIWLPCYDLREVLLEKLRGLSGQRRYAIARDLYDVSALLGRANVPFDEVVPAARSKFAAKGVELSPQVLASLLDRKEEFEADWSRSVERLVPDVQRADFGEAWATTVRALSALVEGSHNQTA